MASAGSSTSSPSKSIEVDSFVPQLSPKEKAKLEFQLEAFVAKHACHHRPIALVTSGGTVADLEVNSVRCLDNFSTGLRGSISVEEFLKRGYAVIHLVRKGSAAPYARVLAQSLGLDQANYGLDVDSLGRLFAGDPNEDTEDIMVQQVLDDDQDAWLTEPSSTKKEDRHHPGEAADGLALHRSIVNSSRIQRALRERSAVLLEGRLLTVYFRSVDEYLGKLQLCAESLRDCRSLAMLYLAAAVSDFYIPLKDRSEHKIQSSGDGNKVPGLELKLSPVPKMLGVLRTRWAPDAFVVSFKLETDKTILRQKAERAVKKYGCHMVIGNLLHTRHDTVWILSPSDGHYENSAAVEDWQLQEVSKPKSGRVDMLEESLTEFVAQSHFEYISWHWNDSSSQASGLEAVMRSHEALKHKKREIQRALYWEQGKQVAAYVLCGVLSYALSSALQKRINGH